MASNFTNKGFFITILSFLLISFFQSTEANWYGKRGEKTDTSLFALLQGTLPDMIDRQLDTQLTLQAIAKLIQDFELRQLQSVEAKGGTK